MMLRSLTAKWKYPVFMDLKYAVSVSRLMNIIFECESVSALVMAISCDQCGGNQGLLAKLGITPDKPYFINPVDALRLIFWFLDWLHLLKNLRSNILDHALITPEGLHISKEDLEDLLPFITAEISSGYKLTRSQWLRGCHL